MQTNETVISNRWVRTLFTNWHFMRWLRLGLGLYLLWPFIQNPDVFTGLISAVFLFQAITDTGCCGASGCTVPSKPETRTVTGDVNYEEVKGEQPDAK